MQTIPNEPNTSETTGPTGVSLPRSPDLSRASDLPLEGRQACEVWTRVMGYHRPVASFNLGKKSEYAGRTFFRAA